MTLKSVPYGAYWRPGGLHRLHDGRLSSGGSLQIFYA